MATSCARCGYGLRPGDIFCPACGFSVGQTGSPSPAAHWDYCEIRDSLAQAGGWFRAEVHALTAVAVGPNGTYNAGEVFYKRTAGYEQLRAQALTRLITKLTQDGWEMLAYQPEEQVDVEGR